MDGILTSAGTLSGSISAQQALTGSLSSVGTLNGELTVAEHIYVPEYTGSYEITPSSQTQTIPIMGLKAADDITVNPIPSNCGLITWNGSTLTVS